MAEERDKLSADLMNRIREQRKLNRQQVRREIAAAVGAGAETFRTGRSAPGVFERWRPDYSDKMMSKREKMKRSQDIYEQQEASEQYYFGQARMRAQARANLLSKNRDAQLRRALDTARRKDGATYRRQTAIIKAQNTAVKNNNTELKRLETPSDGARAHFADMPTYEQRVEAEARRDLEAMKTTGTDIEYRDAVGLPPDATDREVLEVLKKDPSVQEGATQEAKADAKRRIESMAAGNPEDKDLVWAVNEAAKKSGTNPAEIQQSLDVNTQQKTREADTNLTEQIENINDENEAIDGAYEKKGTTLAQQTGDPELVGPAIEEGRVMGSAEREARRIGASRAADVEDVDPEEALKMDLKTTEDLLRRQEQERIAEIGEDGEPVEEGEEEGFLGIEGVKKPGPGAQAHFRAMLEVIEKFPESKPAQHAKAQIMATEEFKAYQKKNFGDTNVDSNVIWKEMVRDWRKQNREAMSEFRKKRREKRSREKAQEFDALTRPLRKDPRKEVAKTVQGASTPGEAASPKDARGII